MIPKVSRGDRAGGLMSYLVGPGRANEHTDPHLVAGDPAVMAWHDDNELSRVSAMEIARHLDRPHKAFDTEVKGGHIWHCSLSLPPQDEQLADEQWGQIAESFVHRMGFDDHEGTKAPMRWAAVRHGLSKNGNDHVHLVVDLVREDGTKASIHNDFIRAQSACRELETEYGLTELESAGRERSTRGYKRGELEAHSRRMARGKFEQERKSGKEQRTWMQLSPSERATRVEFAAKGMDQPRRQMERTVRACATSSRDEAEFVRRLRREGVLVRPRFADGRTDVVGGFSVALRVPKGERPVFYGGGELAKDLTLPRLRQDWPDTPETATAAVAEWTAAKRHRRTVAPGREAQEVNPEAWKKAQKDLAAVRRHLRSVPLDDRAAWASVARETSGVFAAWAQRVGGEQGEALKHASDALSVSAQTWKAGPRQPRSYRSGIGSAALVTASALRGGKGAVGTAVLIRQLATLAKAVHDAHAAAGEAVRAQHIEAMEREHLRFVAARLPEPPKATTETAKGGGPIQEPGPALPPKAEPQAQTARPTPTAGRGAIER